ncbi:MAG: alanine racemase [Proteobacteria bacterium]|nr:alanine racemase [Pseudomonadota bacterium]
MEKETNQSISTLKIKKGRGLRQADWNAMYHRYRDMFNGQRLPLAFVDLDSFDKNIAYVASSQKNSGKTIRVASKSIRSIDLIKRIFEKGGRIYQGILAYTVEEAAFLIDNGFDDIIVAYPSVQLSDLDLLTKIIDKASYLAIMADCKDHLDILSRFGTSTGIRIDVCLDIDMSYRPLGKATHLGVRRSPVRTADQAFSLAQYASNLKGVRITSVMGYEAQVAGVSDDVPGQSIKNSLLRFIKHQSTCELICRRSAVVDRLKNAGCDIRVVNGGGSGSLYSTGKDHSVTEISAGSAFFAPGLFRYYKEVSFVPAAFFALQITRIPAPGMVTCHGGGYIASGEVNPNKLPWPVMPNGLRYISMEGAGEVQTPLILPHDCPKIGIGDPVFFQHAKAGELCERFNHLLLVENDSVVGKAATYRGRGFSFL